MIENFIYTHRILFQRNYYLSQQLIQPIIDYDINQK